MRVRAWIWLLVPLLATARAEGPAFPATESAEEEIRKLDEDPVAAESRRISEELSAVQKEQQKRSEKLYKKLEELHQSESYREYRRKRQALEDKRQSAWDIERKALAEAARTIYAARHAELRGVARAELAEAKRLGFDVLSYPRVDGSTSTGPLGVIVACRILGVPYEWVYPEPTGTPWRNQPDVSKYFLPVTASGARFMPGNYELLLATLKVVAKPVQREQERVAMMINSLLAANSSTHDAYVHLVEGTCDLNLTARPPSESELKLAAEKGVALKLEPVARDGFVVLVNRKNPVKGLTREQVRAIYEERITQWSDVGGGGGKIRAFRRERDSGSRELFDALVMGGDPLPEGERFGPLYANSMGGPFSQLTQQPDGIAYSIYYYEHFMAASPFTRAVPIDGVEPTAASIASGAYPWVTRVYAAYRGGEPADSPAMKLLGWLRSAEGQSVVRESGYVPEGAPAGPAR